MTDIQFNNEAAHGIGQCPACGAAVNVVVSAAERRLRWCCLSCRTVGSAPAPQLGRVSAEGEDESSAALH